MKIIARQLTLDLYNCNSKRLENLEEAKEISRQNSIKEQELKTKSSGINRRERDLKVGEDNLKNNRQKLIERERNIKNKETMLKRRDMYLDDEVNRKATILAERKAKGIDEKYHAREVTFRGYIFIGYAICFIMALLTVRERPVFLKDVKRFAVGTWKVTSFIGGKVMDLTTKLAGFPLNLENEIVGNILHWTILILIPLTFIAGIVIGIIILIRRFGEDFLEKGISKWNISGMVMLLIVIIYLSDGVRRAIPINLVLLWIIMCVLLIGVNWYVYVCRENRGYHW